MKKRLLLLVIFLLVLCGCTKEIDIYDINTEFKDIHIYNVGQEIDMNLDYFASRYDFNRIEVISSNENVARVNYQEKLLILRPGRVTLKIKLFKNNDLIVSVDYGNIIVLDDEYSQYTLINSVSDFQKIKKDGFYYLNADLILDDTFQSIDSFSGALVNPNEYKISASLDAPLFKNIDSAFIEGLVIRGSFNGDMENIASLAYEITSSKISDVRVEASISNGNIVSGLAVQITDTVVERCSFTGEINNGAYIGGMIGIANNSKISNSYVITNFNTLEQDNDVIIGGICSMISGGIIKSSYYSGAGEYKDSDQFSVFANNVGLYYQLAFVYYTVFVDAQEVYDSEYCLYPQTFYISVDDLKKASSLVGLEAFNFQKDQFPTL